MGRHATRHNKRDANEPEIVDALADLGITWIEAGPLDGWAMIKGRFIPIECKMPGEPLTDSQNTFIDLCERSGWPYFIWRSGEDAIAGVMACRYYPMSCPSAEAVSP